MRSDAPTILQEIVARRRTHLAGIAERLQGVDLEKLPPSTRSLYAALKPDAAGAGPAGRGGHRFIMECKSASPSLGSIRADYHPGDIARVYSRYASAISVLCEPERFGGAYEHLATVAASTHLPVLCKDFIVDEVQIYAARYFGADAVLLMLSVVDDEEYSRLAGLAAKLGLDVLTEVVSVEEVQRAVALGATIMGCNHRDLHTLEIDLSRSAALAPHIPPEVAFVAESGVRTNETVRALGGLADGFLVGSQLTGEPDIDRACRELVFGPNKVCGLTSAAAAQTARAAGAIFGGLVIASQSPRFVTPDETAAIIAGEPGLDYVLVSRETSGFQEYLQPGVTALQIHAPHTTAQGERDLVARLRREVGEGIEIWRAVNLEALADRTVLDAIVDAADRIVLDSGAGGTGRQFDWSLIPPDIAGRCLIAGGITPHTVPAALRTGAAGVDLNSGVESQPGVKDPAKVVAAFNAIRRFHHTQPTDTEE